MFFGELFFRAPSMAVAFAMIARMFDAASFSMSELMTFGMDSRDYVVLMLGMVGMFIMSVVREKGIDVRENISRKNIWIRWAIYYGLILLLLIFGAYGQGYVPVDPIYADF